MHEEKVIGREQRICAHVCRTAKIMRRYEVENLWEVILVAMSGLIKMDKDVRGEEKNPNLIKPNC